MLKENIKIYDISRPLKEDMSVYKNRDSKKFQRRIDAIYEEKSMNESSITQLNLHTGTHVDAPFHMLKDGKTIDKINLSNYFGLAKVVDLTFVDEIISLDDIKKVLPKPVEIKRILIKTKNSFSDEYDSKFVYLSKEAAKYLVENKIVLVGIDAMSVERDQKDHPAHSQLLSNGVQILEDIRLKDVPDGIYQLMALPLALENAEASPVRAILLPKDFDIRTN